MASKKLGRPVGYRKPDSLTCMIMVRVSKEQFAYLKKRAYRKGYGYSIGALVRELISNEQKEKTSF